MGNTGTPYWTSFRLDEGETEGVLGQAGGRSVPFLSFD